MHYPNHTDKHTVSFAGPKLNYSWADIGLVPPRAAANLRGPEDFAREAHYLVEDIHRRLKANVEQRLFLDMQRKETLRHDEELELELTRAVALEQAANEVLGEYK